MQARRSTALVAVGALAAVSLMAMLPSSLLARQFGAGIVAVVIGIPCAGIGVLVARRQPGNPLGWLFLTTAVCLFLATDGGDYASLVYQHGHHLPFGHQVLTWRRSAGVLRQQVKWLASGAAVTMASAVVAIAFSSPGPSSTLRDWADNLAWFGLAALPLSMGVGILRYRLYEIDRIISRTLAYAVVTALLVGVYAALVLLSTHVLTVNSPVAVAASTLAAAALFSPLRRRVQRVVDRRFNRARYDADLTSVVSGTLEPSHVSLWLSDGGVTMGK